MEIQLRDLGLDIDVLMMAKFEKSYKRVSEKITSEFSRRQNITKTKLFSMLLQTMSTGLDYRGKWILVLNESYKI